MAKEHKKPAKKEYLTTKQISILIGLTIIFIVAIVLIKIYLNNTMLSSVNITPQAPSNAPEGYSTSFSIENANFENGLRDWASDEGMKSGGNEQGNWEVISTGCHDSKCLNMTCEVPSCRLLYMPSSTERFGKTNNLNPDSYLKIPNATKKVTFSLWTKGCPAPTIWLQSFNSQGVMVTTYNKDILCSDIWKETNMTVNLKDTSKFFYFEITENSPVSSFLLDNISIKALN